MLSPAAVQARPRCAAIDSNVLRVLRLRGGSQARQYRIGAVRLGFVAALSAALVPMTCASHRLGARSSPRHPMRPARQTVGSLPAPPRRSPHQSAIHRTRCTKVCHGRVDRCGSSTAAHGRLYLRRRHGAFAHNEHNATNLLGGRGRASALLCFAYRAFRSLISIVLESVNAHPK